MKLEKVESVASVFTKVNHHESVAMLITHDRLNTHKAVVELAPSFKNTKTGEVTYDAGVMEYMARIDKLFGVSTDDLESND